MSKLPHLGGVHRHPGLGQHVLARRQRRHRDVLVHVRPRADDHRIHVRSSDHLDGVPSEQGGRARVCGDKYVRVCERESAPRAVCVACVACARARVCMCVVYLPTGLRSGRGRQGALGKALMGGELGWLLFELWSLGQGQG